MSVSTPCECGYRPVRMLARLAALIGVGVQHRWKCRPSPARRSRLCVLICGWPSKPARPADWLLTVIRMTLGPEGMARLTAGLLAGAESVVGRLARGQEGTVEGCVAGLEDNRLTYGPVILSPDQVVGAAAHPAAAVSEMANPTCNNHP